MGGGIDHLQFRDIKIMHLLFPVFLPDPEVAAEAAPVLFKHRVLQDWASRAALAALR